MRPTPRTLWVILVILLLGLITPWWPDALWYWAGLVALASLVISFDAIMLLLQSNPIEAQRSLIDTLSLGAWHKVKITLSNTGRRREKLDVVDHYPTSFISEANFLGLKLGGNSEQNLDYRIKPTERGHFEFKPIQIRRYSPWSFWTSSHFLGNSLDTKVFPDFSAISRYALRGADSMQSVAAEHIQQRRGEGLDFHQLREYRVGDTFRQIDWKATARAQKLVTKEFQEERDQQVIFMLDSGRRMLARDGELSHFDHVLNSVLLLSYIALRQGDAVGYLTCEPDPKWMRPTKGRSTINTLSQNLFDLQPQPQAVDYWHAATELSKRQKRRAMIILLTNIRDEDSQEFKKALGLLRQKHLVVVASLVEDVIQNTMEKPVENFHAAATYAATQQYIQTRREVHQSMRYRGVYIHDTNCKALPQVLTDQYLAIKRAGIL